MARIALTGTSSTGKTTTAAALMNVPEFVPLVEQFLTEDARALLQERGHGSMDNMSRQELRAFQREYFVRKARREESLRSYMVDRSFVDVAAYWLVRDAYDLPAQERNEVLLPCMRLARQYDLHFFFPMGQISFEPDGFRSEKWQFHADIGEKILSLLSEWAIPYETIAAPDLDARVHQILQGTRRTVAASY